MARLKIFTIPVFIYLVLRLAAIALSITSLYYLGYIAEAWHHTFGVAIAFVSLAIVVDLISIGFLFAVRYDLNHMDTGWTTITAIVLIALGVVGIVELIGSSMHYGNAPTGYPMPWFPTEEMTTGLLSGLIAMRVMFLVLECITCCVRHSRTKKRRRAEQEGRELASNIVVVTEQGK